MTANKDEAITFLLAEGLSHLQNAETMMMGGGGVSAAAWPYVGRILSEISHTMKQIELAVSGIGGH